MIGESHKACKMNASREKEVRFLMIQTTIKKPYIIEETDAKKFNDLVDEFIESKALQKPEAVVEYADGKFIAVIYYEKEVVETETVSDEFKLKGITYVCGECPFYVLSKDKRIKYSECEKGHRRCYYDQPACEELYQLIKEGKVEL